MGAYGGYPNPQLGESVEFTPKIIDFVLNHFTYDEYLNLNFKLFYLFNDFSNGKALYYHPKGRLGNVTHLLND